MLIEAKKGQNIQLSPNFYSNEFDCKCSNEDCKTTKIDLKLIEYLQSKRELVKIPIKINSGFRCLKHNASIGGAKNSFHTKGMAADIVLANAKIRDYLIHFKDSKGLGIYNTFLHVDVRDVRARWYGK